MPTPSKPENAHKTWVLASSSPYRRTILEKLKRSFETASPHIDETARPLERPEQLAQRLARQKAEALIPEWPHALIIGSDQVGECDGVLLEKPGTFEIARQQLIQSSGKIVRFHTAVCVLDASTQILKESLDLTEVHFKTLQDDQIDRYLKLEQPFDCAGSFKSESLGISLFDRIVGEDPNALVGLPLIRLIALLNECGEAIP